MHAFMNNPHTAGGILTSVPLRIHNNLLSTMLLQKMQSGPDREPTFRLT